jgi:hypothetical protein
MLAAWWMPAGISLAGTLDDIPACFASNVPEKSSVLTLELRSRDQVGGDYVQEARLYWQRSAGGPSKTLLCMTSPREVRGLSYLVHTDESGHTLWVYLPEEGKVVRINPGAAASRGHIARTAISYEDLRYLPLNLSEAAPEKGPETVVEGRSVGVVRLTLRPESNSRYSRVTFFVDPETCVPLKTDFHEMGDKLRKTAMADPDAIHREGKISLARSIRIKDLKREVETDLIVEEVQIDSDLPDRIFDPQSQRGRCPN